MEPDQPVSRERHLLALRAAVPVLIVGAAMIALFTPLPKAAGDGFWSTLAIVALGSPATFGLIYGFRYACPNRKRALEPGQTGERPTFALGSAFGAFLGVCVLSTVVVVSIALDPVRGSPRDDVALPLLAGGFLAAAVTGVFIYLFSAVLYLRVLKVRDDTDELAIPIVVALMAFQWIVGIVEQARKHPFLEALGIATYTTGTVVLAMGLGWAVYSRFVPSFYNPFKSSRRPRAKVD